MGFGIYSRALVASYIFRRSVLAWRCTVCRKMFSIPLGEAQQRAELTAPAYIEQEFRAHSCEMVLVSEQESPEVAELVKSWTK